MLFRSLRNFQRYNPTIILFNVDVRQLPPTTLANCSVETRLTSRNVAHRQFPRVQTRRVPVHQKVQFDPVRSAPPRPNGRREHLRQSFLSVRRMKRPFVFGLYLNFPGFRLAINANPDASEVFEFLAAANARFHSTEYKIAITHAQFWS